MCLKNSLDRKPFQYAPPSGELDVIFEDEHVLLANKPSGLLSVPGKAEDHKDCLETRLRHVYPELRLVHRLDLPTSGIMIFARNHHAQRHLGLQFEKRQIRKNYIAQVSGSVQGITGHINLPLICDWPNRPIQKVCFETGKPSQTDWEVESRCSDSTRLRLYPRTGRSHQLRVHAMAIGHPILGDNFYADDRAFNAAPRLLLHAHSLSFRHPEGGRGMSLSVPCPF